MLAGIWPRAGRRDRAPALPGTVGRCLPLALEPRLLFDGAALATADVAMAAPTAGLSAGGGDGLVGATGPGGVPARAGDGVTGEASAGNEALLQIAASGAEICEPVAISLQKGAFADCAALDAALQAGHEAIGAADASGVDAADTVHYAISISNRGTDNAYDLQVRDQLPAQVDQASVSQLRLVAADGREIDYSGGNVLRNAASGEAIRTEAAFADALFSDCAVEFIDPGCGQGYLGGSCEGDRPSQVTIVYEVTMPQTAVAGSELCNQASVVQVAAQECGVNLVDACSPPADDATVTIDAARLTTRLTGTSQVHTAGAEAVIGEILTYETVITIPEGSSPDAVLTQWLGARAVAGGGRQHRLHGRHPGAVATGPVGHRSRCFRWRRGQPFRGGLRRHKQPQP